MKKKLELLFPQRNIIAEVDHVHQFAATSLLRAATFNEIIKETLIADELFLH